MTGDFVSHTTRPGTLLFIPEGDDILVRFNKENYFPPVFLRPNAGVCDDHTLRNISYISNQFVVVIATQYVHGREWVLLLSQRGELGWTGRTNDLFNRCRI